jgi:pimeloyl-ACP methyl ester carboxylesterase
MQSDYINVRGIAHHFLLLNKEWLSSGKPLLVFLHEGLGSIAQWKDVPKLLSQKVQCPALVYDRYGHGLSEQLHEARDLYFIHQQAQLFLPALLQNLNLHHMKIILIGHSDGGSIAIIHAGSFPEKTAGIITIAAHVFLEDISLQGIRAAVKSFEEGLLRDLLYKYHGNKTDSMFNGWAQTWPKPEFRNWNIEEFLPAIKAPFLAIQGDTDQYGSYAQLDAIKKQVVKAQIQLIPDCGHIPHLQQKDMVLEIISRFINGILNDSAL